MSMSSGRRRGESKQLKRDHQVRREVLDELGSEIVQAHLEPQYRKSNRDQARGDWDRTGRRTDEGVSRDEAEPGDSLRAPTK